MGPEKALELLSGNSGKARPINQGDQLEFAIRVLLPEQQQIEFKNIIVAWDGSINLASGRPVVLDSKTLMRTLINLTPDMPGLLKRDGSPSKSTAAPAPRPTQQSDKSPTSTSAGAPQCDDVPEAVIPKQSASSKFTGLTSLIYKMVIFEALLSLVAIIWALTTASWLLALVMLIFGFFNTAKGGMMGAGVVQGRWFGMGMNVAVASLIFVRVVLLGGHKVMSESAVVLSQSVFYWMLMMAFLHLICFDFARQVREQSK
jgi:hypothetical protein